MATIKFRGDAPSVGQVTTIAQTGTWSAGETASLVINAKTLTVTATASMNATEMTAALSAMVNGDAITAKAETRNTTGDLVPEFSDITASVVTTTLTLTGDNERPFTVTVADTAASGAVGSPSTTRAATGPAHIIAANFEGGSLPTTSDTVVFTGATPVLYQVDALSASGIVHVIFEAGFADAGVCGLPNRGSASAGEFDEYLPQYLVLPADCAITIGQGGGRGSSRIRIDAGGGASTVRVYTTAPAFDDDRYAVDLKNTGANSILYLHAGEVDFCREVGSTGTLTTVHASGDSRLRCGAGATLTTINVDGGTAIETASAITTVNLDGGTLDTYGGTITTLNLLAGTFRPHAGGTITTANLSAASFLVLENVGAITITTLNIKTKGFEYRDRYGVATITNGVPLTPGVSLLDGIFDPGPGRTVTVS